MQEISTYKNEEFGEIRTVTINSEPWFVAKDISETLGYAQTSNMIKRIDEEDFISSALDGMNMKSILINESGLYSAIFGSRLESAKGFKHWVTSEVLPSIRKNGGYIANQEHMSQEQLLAKAYIVAQNIYCNQKKQIEELQPKADYFNDLVDRKHLTNFRNTAKELGIKEKDFINFLIRKKYIFRDQYNKLLPYSNKNNGLFEIKDFRSRTSVHTGVQTFITLKGKEVFRKLIRQDMN